MATWRPDLLTLRLFVAVCEEKSIARAAEREAIDSSAISKRIAEIEAVVGVSLLRRGARGVTPTPAGLALLGHARQIVLGTERLKLDLGSYAGSVNGHVRLLANLSAGIEELPADLSSFVSANRGVCLDVQDRISPATLKGVRDGVAEIAICVQSDDTADLQAHWYGSMERVLVTPRAHPLAQRGEVAFADVVDSDFVAISQDSGTTRLLTQVGARLGRDLHYVMYSGSLATGCHVIAQGLGVGIFSLAAVRPYLPQLDLAATRLSDEWARRRMMIYVRDEALLAAPARALLAHLLAREDARQQLPS